MRKADLRGALLFFADASWYSSREEWRHEVKWQRNLQFASFTETDLLRETAWVVLCSGFSERIIRERFGYVSLCFCDWESAEAIVEADPICRICARSAFRNERKLAAILDIARRVYAEGFDAVRESIERDPITEFRKFPQIGPITTWHLAKNLGLDVVKPDRHLSRLAKKFGFKDAFEVCREISRVTGEPRSVVDVVMWRYLANNPQALQ